MRHLYDLIVSPILGPIILFSVYLGIPAIITSFFNNSYISNNFFFLIVFILFILISDLIFVNIYKIKNKYSYKKIEKIPFNQIAVEPHPNLPFIHKTKFHSEKKKSDFINFPLHTKTYRGPILPTNNLGYVNGNDGNRDVLMPKPKDVFRINCLGASTTQYYLSYKDHIYSYPLELEKILKEKNNLNLEVNNCGTGGYTSSDLLVRFLLQIIDTSPDVLVIYHGYNDISSYLTSDFKSDYSHSRKNLGETYFKYYLGSLMPYIPINFINCLQNKWFSQNSRYSLVDSISKGQFKIDNKIEEGLRSYERNIQHIITVCKSYNIEVILSTYCFFLHEKAKDVEIHKVYENIINKENLVIKKLAAKNNLKLVDAYNLIPKNNNNFVDTVHFTHNGMKLLAKHISEQIKI